MRIVNKFPPNIDKIRAGFKLSGSEIFAYGGTIYNPQGGELPPWLIQHETVHRRQQKAFGGTEAWWDRYLVDPEWRFQQELEAHIAEYDCFVKTRTDRTERRMFLKSLARRLSSPMYGNMVSFDTAKKLLKKLNERHH